VRELTKKERTYGASNWEEFLAIAETINPMKETIILTGWINSLDEKDRMEIKRFFFTIRPVTVIKKIESGEGIDITVRLSGKDENFNVQS
jgi:hypothetical protein